MEFIEFILASLTSAGVVKSLMLLLLEAEDLMTNEYVKEQMEHYMKYQKDVRDKDKAREFVSWAFNDNFSEQTLKRNNTSLYQFQLEVVRNNILDFYFKTIDKLSEEKNDINMACDVDSTLSDFVIQLMRIRMVVQPEIRISNGVHPVSKIKYLYVKSYWLSDQGKKVRKFTKLIGKTEDYKFGIKDPQALEDGLNLIQPVMYEHYKELYID